MFFSNEFSSEQNGWETIFSAGAEFEAELLKAFLTDSNIESHVISQRDRMLTMFSHTLPFRVVVRAEHKEEALRILGEYQHNFSPITSLRKEQSN
jgi:hypothetical protein